MARFTSRTFVSRLSRGTFAVALVALAVGCTSAKNDSSSISITLPDFNQTLPNAKAKSQKLSAQGGVAAYSTVRIPTRVMINVTGPGMPPIVKIIERRELVAHLISEKELSFRLDVPRGSGRLIQLLAITADLQKDTSGNELDESGETFFYGDVVRDITSRGDENVDLAVKQVDVGTGGADGVIAGRILDDANSGPTGKLAIKFTPPSRTNAPMVVSQTEIHGGWFEVFALEGAGFSYSLENGSDIFTNVQLKATQPPVYRGAVQSFDQSRAFVSVPQGFVNLYLPQASTPFARREEKPKKYIFGFFGPGASGKKICFNNSNNPSIDDLYTSADITNLTKVGWAGSGAPTATQAGVDAGGSAVAGGLCSDGTYWLDRLSVDISRLRNGHGTLNFRGPFRIFPIASDSDQGIIDVKWNPTNAKYDVKYRFLPGATGEKRVNGVGVFTRVLTTAENNYDRAPYEEDDGIACNKLTDSSFLAQPFSLHSRVPVQGDGSAIQTASLGGFVGNETANQRLQVVLCPYSDSREGYFGGAIDFRGGNYGSGPTVTPRAQLKLSTDSGAKLSLVDDICRAMRISLFDTSNNALPVPSGGALSVNLSWRSFTTGMTASFYSGSTCSAGEIITSTTIPAGASEKIVYFRPEAPGFLTMRAEPTTQIAGYQLDIDENTFGVIPTTAPSVHQLRVDLKVFPRAVVAGQCYPVDFQLETSDHLPTYVTTGTVTGSFAGSLSGTYYSTRDCTGATVGGLTIPMGNHGIRYWFKPHNVGTQQTALDLSAITVTNNASSSGIANIIGTTNISITPAGAVSSLTVRFASTHENFRADGLCKYARVVALSAYGAEVNVTSNRTGTVALTSGGEIYPPASTNCSTGGVNSSRDFVINAGQSGSEWFKVKESAPVLQYMNFAFTGLATMNHSAPILPPSDFSLEMHASNYIVDFCHPVKLRAKRDGAFYGIPVPYSIEGVAVNSGYIYSNASCIGTPKASISLAAGSSLSETFYLKPTSDVSAPEFSHNGLSYLPLYIAQMSAHKTVPRSYTLISFAGDTTGTCRNFTVKIDGMNSAEDDVNIDLKTTVGTLHEGLNCTAAGSPEFVWTISKSQSGDVVKQMSVNTANATGSVQMFIDTGPNRFRNPLYHNPSTYSFVAP
jgi:hypothetical protein